MKKNIKRIINQVEIYKDPSCKLWLPFYLYGNEQSKIWDYSGNNNHGIIYGAGFRPYPLLLGVELVDNGGMEEGNPPTGWGSLNNPEVFERSSDQKRLGNYSCHINDSTPSYGGFFRFIPVVAYQKYRLNFWYYLVSGTLIVSLYNNASGQQDYYGEFNTTGSWINVDEIYTGSGTGSITMMFINGSNSNPARFYIDEVSVRKVIGYEGIGWHFDGVDDYIDLGTGDWANITGDITIIAWIKYNDIFRINTIARKGTTNSPFVLFTYNATIDFYYTINSSWGGIYVSMDNNLSNRWMCVCATRKFSGSLALLELYINGYRVSYTTRDGIPDTTTVKASIGYDNQSAGYMKGHIGEVIIFNRALSPQEIRNYYELTRHIYGV